MPVDEYRPEQRRQEQNKVQQDQNKLHQEQTRRQEQARELPNSPDARLNSQ
jgi:hypothetical protein